MPVEDLIRYFNAADAAFRSALASGADLGLGRLFGEPAAACHPTHAAQRVAYNSPSSFGAHP
ncbi:MAG: hypothetical protein ACK4FE_13800 [Azonexus sp.]